MKHMKTIAMISAACLIFTGMTAALPASADFAAADINSDGAVSVEDAQYILRFYTQKIVADKPIRWADIVKPTSK